MTAKKGWVLGIVCLSIIASYQAGKLAGEHSAKSILAKQELVFREEMEATRRREFAQLRLLYEEEKQAEEKRRRKERAEARETEYSQSLTRSRERQSDLVLAAIQAMQASQPELPGRIPTIPELMAANHKSVSTGQKEEPEQPRTANKEKSEGSTDGGQYKLFETTTIDGWVKKIKRGTIFKTSSGNIYEVAKAVILFEMELRPKVTVLTDGQFYKLLIQGVNEELLCKKLNPRNKGTNSGSAVIEARITNDFDGLEHGNIYKLDNGQVWEQTDFYIYIYIAVMPRVTIWQDGSVHKLKVDGIDKVVTVKQVK